jgi:membrane-bound lytic murein transglycosylase B
METSQTARTGISMVLAILACGIFPVVAMAEEEITETDFQRIGSMYGVSPYLLLAISLIESQGGTLLGTHEVRNVVDEKQLKYLQKIADRTKRDISEFKGSYAGAMGYMQIVPATFYTYAQDGNGDGIKDPLNHLDSLATAAYFLARTIAVKGSLRPAIKTYNNSNAYCNKVLKLSENLELESTFAARQ